MSGDTAEGVVGIEMEELEKEDPTDVEYRPTEKEKKELARQSYEERFESILTDYYDDKKTWWDAVEDLLKKDGDFAEKVSCRCDSRPNLRGALKCRRTRAGCSEVAGGRREAEEAGDRRSDGGPPPGHGGGHSAQRTRVRARRGARELSCE